MTAIPEVNDNAAYILHEIMPALLYQSLAVSISRQDLSYPLLCKVFRIAIATLQSM
jgi:hypothetical protein